MLMIALRVEAGLIIESLPLMTHRLSLSGSPSLSLSLTHSFSVSLSLSHSVSVSSSLFRSLTPPLSSVSLSHRLVVIGYIFAAAFGTGSWLGCFRMDCGFRIARS